MNRTVFYISDGTGISAEALGHSLITQFENIPFQFHTLPYINTEEKAKDAVLKIDKAYNSDKSKPLVFSTIVKPALRNIIAQSHGFVIDFFQSFLGALETELNTKASSIVGLSHAVTDEEQYHTRIEAVHFALQCDDGVNTQAYKSADIILLGVSRTGKTPTCLYLALQHGIRAANYPLTPEDLQTNQLPAPLIPYRKCLFGLTIYPDRLHTIRTKRKPMSTYAAINQCEKEIQYAENLFSREKIPFINSTHLSIEELSTQILVLSALKH